MLVGPSLLEAASSLFQLRRWPMADFPQVSVKRSYATIHRILQTQAVGRAPFGKGVSWDLQRYYLFILVDKNIQRY